MLWKNPYDMEILLKPIITEKMTAQSEKLNRFGFIVDRNANKIQIKKAVEKMYNVTVETVNTLRYAGKNKSRYTKTGMVHGTTNAFKKAIVTLKEGETIDFYSNI
jgi:large subunit ribosomal protein L23